jgi:glyoxylase-like metal-dependent hydrolase (beta-lactamase superfamily II)
VTNKQRREISAGFFCLVNRHFPSNTYVIRITESKCVIIDPGLDFDMIDSFLNDEKLSPELVLCTHGHFDHLGSAARVQKKFSVPVHLSAKDVKIAKSGNFLLMVTKIDQRIEMPSFENTFAEDAQTVKTESGEEFKFHSAPGHTPGSCCIHFRNWLFTGDTLYSKAVGLSDLPGEDPEILAKSILSIFAKFPSETIVFPGHGASATLAQIQQNNGALRDFLTSRNLTLDIAQV